MTLRDYQIDISDKAAVCLREYGLVYLGMEQRTGKSITAFETAKKYGVKKVLFVTKKKAILSIETDYQHYKDCFACTIINYESVSKCKGVYDLVIIDEAHSCFIGSTLIDGVQIKDLKEGDFIKSFNTATKNVESKRVSRIFKNKLEERLVKIRAGGKEIICTESHLLYTKRGWVEACRVKEDDEVLMV